MSNATDLAVYAKSSSSLYPRLKTFHIVHNATYWRHQL